MKTGKRFCFIGFLILAVALLIASAKIQESLCIYHEKIITINLIVDYDLPLKEAIALGNYNSANYRISKDNFPLEMHQQGKKEIVCRLFDFKGEANDQQAINSMKVAGFEPANLRELLAFGQTYHQPMSVISLQVTKSDLLPGVAVIAWRSEKYNLELHYPKGTWDGDQYQFLGVKK